MSYQSTSTSTSSRRTGTTSQRSIPSSSNSSRRVRQTPPKYTIDRVISSDGISSEVLTIEDTPPLPTPTSSRSNSPYASNSRPESNYDEPAPKKRRNNGERSHVPVASTSSYRKDESSNINSNGSSSKASGSTTKGKRNLDAYQGYTNGNGKESGSSSKARQQNVVADSEKACDKDGHFIVNAKGDRELLDNRFTVMRLLGQGTFGKVVSAYDTVHKKNVAIKIIRAVKKYQEASKVEVKVLKLIVKNDPNDVNKCIHLEHVFNHYGHVCLVTELLSGSVFDFLKENQYHPFPFSHIQHFAKQLINSVRFLHSLSLIHTDLKPENILLETTAHSIQRSVRLKKQTKVLNNPNLRLIDFGSATFDQDYHASVVSTRHYRAPEIILGTGWSYPCDAWSIGCILIEFYTGEALFQTHENVEHLAMMEKVFGEMPANLIRDVTDKEKAAYFTGRTPNKKLHFPAETTTKQSRNFVDQMKTLDEIVKPVGPAGQRFLSLLDRLLQWEPAARITPEEALDHPFFKCTIDDEGSASFPSRPKY